MKVGLLGQKQRAAAWEKHLRLLAAVSEVVITSKISDLESVDACIILDDTPQNLNKLEETVRLKLHTFLVAQLPTELSRLKKVYALVQESEVQVQFSHWPTISPSSQWMKQQLPRPESIQIYKELSHLSFSENKVRFTHLWRDEVAWVVKWMDMGIHKIEANRTPSGSDRTAIQIYIKFENGSSASIYCLSAGSEELHKRVAAGGDILLNCDVLQQSVFKAYTGRPGELMSEIQKFDATKAAELSAALFIKAIKLNKESAFTSYDALQAAMAIDKIEKMIQNPSISSSSSASS